MRRCNTIAQIVETHKFVVWFSLAYKKTGKEQRCDTLVAVLTVSKGKIHLVPVS